MRFSTVRATALLAIGTLAACSGGGGPSSPIPPHVPTVATGAPQNPSGETRATFVVHWPSVAQAAATARKRNTISASTQSVSVSVNGGVATIVNKPTISGSTSVSIPAPAGNDAFTFTAWDEVNATGNILDQASATQNIVANANNTVSVALDGVCAALVPTLYASSVYAQTHSITTPVNAGSRTILKTARLVGNFVQSFAFTPVDADGNTILAGGGTGSISVTESGPTPHVTIAANAAGAANTIFKVTPLAAEPDGFSTQLTASSPNCGPGTAALPNSFALSTSAEVIVADYYNGVIAFDQDGAQLATVSTTTGMSGLAYNSKSNYLVTIEPTYGGSTKGIVAFQTFSTTGSALGSGYFTPTGYTTSDTNASGQLAYNPVNGYFVVAIAMGTDSAGNTVYGSLQNIAISGSTATAESSLFTGSASPMSLAIQPNGTVITNDTSSGATESYTSPECSCESSEVPVQGAAYAVDSLRGNFLAINDSYSGDIISSSFAVTPFTLPPPNAGYQSAAYSQGEDEFYAFGPSFFGAGATIVGLTGSVVYSGGSSISNLPSGAFASIVDPIQTIVVP